MCEHVGEACICKLAKCLSRCPNITHLDLSGNNLGVLPEEGIASLKKLEYLDVSGS
jgi:Leucine-rich repeat (LRR) protein